MACITLEKLLGSNPELELQLHTVTEARLNEVERRQSAEVANTEGAFIAIENVLRYCAGRCIVGIGGFPGSGKTSLAIHLAERVNTSLGRTVAVHLPMDGFHFRNEKLVAMKRDHVKGAISTYDIDSYLDLLRRFVEQPAHVLLAPDYDRSRHDVIENAIEVPCTARLLITEGLYVGLPYEKWGAVSSLLALSMFLDSEPRICLERIVARNVQAGRSEVTIRDKLGNDLMFMKRSLDMLATAELLVRR